MSQQLIQFTTTGLMGLSIGQPIAAAILPMKPIQQYPKPDYIEYNTDRYQFYFLAEAAQYKTLYGNVVTNVFAAVDSTNIIKAVTIFVTDASMTLQDSLDAVFGKKALRSTSSADGHALNSHCLWGIDDTSAMFSRSTYEDNGITAEILIYGKYEGTSDCTPTLRRTPRVYILKN